MPKCQIFPGSNTFTDSPVTTTLWVDNGISHKLTHSFSCYFASCKLLYASSIFYIDSVARTWLYLKFHNLTYFKCKVQRPNLNNMAFWLSKMAFVKLLDLDVCLVTLHQPTHALQPVSWFFFFLVVLQFGPTAGAIYLCPLRPPIHACQFPSALW